MDGPLPGCSTMDHYLVGWVDGNYTQPGECVQWARASATSVVSRPVPAAETPPSERGGSLFCNRIRPDWSITYVPTGLISKQETLIGRPAQQWSSLPVCRLSRGRGIICQHFPNHWRKMGRRASIYFTRPLVPVTDQSFSRIPHNPNALLLLFKEWGALLSLIGMYALPSFNPFVYAYSVRDRMPLDKSYGYGSSL